MFLLFAITSKIYSTPPAGLFLVISKHVLQLTLCCMRWGEEFLSEAVNNPFYIRLPQQVTLGVIIHRFYRIKPGKGRCTRTQRTLLLQGWKFRTSLINFWRTLYLISLVDEIKQQLHENDSYLCVCRCQKDRLGLMPHF